MGFSIVSCLVFYFTQPPEITPLTLQTEPLHLLPVPTETNEAKAAVKEALIEQPVWWSR